MIASIPSGIVPAIVAARDAVATKEFSKRPVLYISGPMRGVPDDAGPWENVRRGLHAARMAWHAGWLPFCPMLNAVWEMVSGVLDPAADDGAGGWLNYDFAWVGKSAAVCRLPGKSYGGDREVVQSQEHCEWGTFYPPHKDGYVTYMPTPEEIRNAYESASGQHSV